MPTVLRVRGYAIGFYAADGDEPQHVHVKMERKEAKYWYSLSFAWPETKDFGLMS